VSKDWLHHAVNGRIGLDICTLLFDWLTSVVSLAFDEELYGMDLVLVRSWLAPWSWWLVPIYEWMSEWMNGCLNNSAEECESRVVMPVLAPKSTCDDYVFALLEHTLCLELRWVLLPLAEELGIWAGFGMLKSLARSWHCQLSMDNCWRISQDHDNLLTTEGRQTTDCDMGQDWVSCNV